MAEFLSTDELLLKEHSPREQIKESAANPPPLWHWLVLLFFFSSSLPISYGNHYSTDLSVSIPQVWLSYLPADFGETFNLPKTVITALYS